MPTNDTLCFLSVSHAQNILFRSFLLSQGDGGLQRGLLRYLAMTHPTWRLARQAEQDLAPATIRACTRFLAGNWHREMTAPLIEKEVCEYSEEFSDALKEDPRKERPLLLGELMTDIVKRDYYYLVAKDGRPRPRAIAGSARTGATPRAAYFSHFCHYGLLHQPTGAAEFDELFAEIAQAFHDQGETWHHCLARPADRLRLRRVLVTHNTRYPDHPVPIPAQLLLDGEPASAEAPGDMMPLAS
jgi:hypothetical protein